MEQAWPMLSSVSHQSKGYLQKLFWTPDQWAMTQWTRLSGEQKRKSSWVTTSGWKATKPWTNHPSPCPADRGLVHVDGLPVFEGIKGQWEETDCRQWRFCAITNQEGWIATSSIAATSTSSHGQFRAVHCPRRTLGFVIAPQTVISRPASRDMIPLYQG